MYMLTQIAVTLRSLFVQGTQGTPEIGYIFVGCLHDFVTKYRDKFLE